MVPTYDFPAISHLAVQSGAHSTATSVHSHVFTAAGRFINLQTGFGGSGLAELLRHRVQQDVGARFQITHVSGAARHAANLIGEIRCLAPRHAIARRQQHQQRGEHRTGAAVVVLG